MQLSKCEDVAAERAQNKHCGTAWDTAIQNENAAEDDFHHLVEYLAKQEVACGQSRQLTNEGGLVGGSGQRRPVD